MRYNSHNVNFTSFFGWGEVCTMQLVGSQFPNQDEPAPSAVKGWSPNYWTTGEFPKIHYFTVYNSVFFVFFFFLVHSQCCTTITILIQNISITPKETLYLLAVTLSRKTMRGYSPVSPPTLSLLNFLKLFLFAGWDMANCFNLGFFDHWWG